MYWVEAFMLSIFFCMQIHCTKGIVLRTIIYGETSIITTIYTELFGIQHYIVKGVRQSTKKSHSKAIYFQPAAILEVEVYHNELKNLQFIKEFQWAVIYEQLFSNVTKHAIAIYIIELLHRCLKQPEPNSNLFYIVENILQKIDTQTDRYIANIPVYFILQLTAELGFQIHGKISEDTPILDLKEGQFVKDTPLHPFYVGHEQSLIISKLLHMKDENELGNILLNRTLRQQLLQTLQLFISLHIADFGEIKSLSILQEILS